MRKHTFPTIIATAVLAALALTGCTAGSGTTPDATASPSASAKAGKGTDVRPAAGLEDVTGKCVDGVSTPVQDGKKITIGDCKLVDVMGSKNTITAGNVAKLTIEGSGNTVTVKSTTEVTTIGDDNTVVYESGKEPAFNEHATGNTVRPTDADKSTGADGK